MLFSRSTWLAAAVVACGMFSVALTWAQKPADKAVEKTEAEKTAEVVAQLGVAAELAAFGRGELTDITGIKDVKSPEALVAAGAILLRIHKQTGGKMSPSEATVMDDAGKTVADESSASESLADEAAALFDEARALPSKDKAALEAQIKQAETVPERGVVVGPKVVNRVITTGKPHHVHVAVKPNVAGAITVRGTGKTHFEVHGNGGNVLWKSQGPHGVYHLHSGHKDVKVKVLNNGGPPAKYRVYSN